MEPCEWSDREWVWGVEELRGCPHRLVSPQSKSLIGMHALLERGVLPYSGGWFDQPHCYADAMVMLTSMEEDHRVKAKVSVVHTPEVKDGSDS